MTHEHLTVKLGGRDVFIDIGAEQLLAAERGETRIAVEVKSFIKPSPIQDLKESVGQFIVYAFALRQSEKHQDRTLYLAIRTTAYEDVFEDKAVQMLIAEESLRFVLFDPEKEEIKKWIPEITTPI